MARFGKTEYFQRRKTEYPRKSVDKKTTFKFLLPWIEQLRKARFKSRKKFWRRQKNIDRLSSVFSRNPLQGELFYHSRFFTRRKRKGMRHNFKRQKTLCRFSHRQYGLSKPFQKRRSRKIYDWKWNFPERLYGMFPRFLQQKTKCLGQENKQRILETGRRQFVDVV